MIRPAFAKSIRSRINCKACIRYSVFRRGNLEPSFGIRVRVVVGKLCLKTALTKEHSNLL